MWENAGLEKENGVKKPETRKTETRKTETKKPETEKTEAKNREVKKTKSKSKFAQLRREIPLVDDYVRFFYPNEEEELGIRFFDEERFAERITPERRRLIRDFVYDNWKEIEELKLGREEDFMDLLAVLFNWDYSWDNLAETIRKRFFDILKYNSDFIFLSRLDYCLRVFYPDEEHTKLRWTLTEMMGEITGLMKSVSSLYGEVRDFSDTLKESSEIDEIMDLFLETNDSSPR